MSDYIFRPRLKMPANDWNLTYYAANPYSSMQYRMMEQYCYGRFWELIDFYINNPTINDPDKLGYIRIEDRTSGTSNYRYMQYPYWENAGHYDTADIWYYNTDDFDRAIIPSYGSIVEFSGSNSVYMGIVEKITDNNNYILSSIDLTPSPQVFTTLEVINGVLTHRNRQYTLSGVIFNPINDDYDVILGRELYWKLPFWMYKRYLDRRRGLLYE